MKEKQYGGKYKNCILTFAIMALNVLLMALCFDFYYDLNDDMLMKDVMSGVYTGTPDGHNMQTLYSLGAFLAWCYRLCGRVPWYGLFLCLCQFGCFFLTGVRLTGMLDCRSGSYSPRKEPGDRRAGIALKIIVLSALCLFQWGIFLTHLVNVQYTVTCALMSATAIFLFVTTPHTDSAKEFVVRNLPSILLVIVAYQLRTEMLLLTLPFVALAGVSRWAEEERIFTRTNWMKYGTVIGVMLAGMVLSGCVDLAAYGSADWKDFRRFFDARTTVYDYYPEVITQEEYGQALEGLGVTRAQQTLLCNYNFGLDDSIDTQMLDKVADYAANTVGASRDWGAVFGEQLRLYLYRTFHGADAPYNVMVLWAYAAVLAAGICACGSRHRYAFLWQAALLVGIRTVLWMFILMRGRDPERITHSLYLVEFMLLMAWLVRLISESQIRNYVLHGMAVLFLLLTVGNLPEEIRMVELNQQARAAVNSDWQDIDAYCRAHEENYYFEDVYSTVAFSQKMFDRADNTYANYDILGGWLCKSPLWQEKLARYHIGDAARALVQEENVYLIVSDTEAGLQGFDWIVEYYAGQGIAVSVEQGDRINEHYGVYRIKKTGTKQV
ncbi:MAG: hypothetical protein J6A08_00380 [Lachnospiraceae bacterium]|nr:hypothetical protein [Lachnospiraceae bacterium]